MAVTEDDLAQYCNLSAVPPAGPKLVEFQRFLAAAKQHVSTVTGRIDGTATLRVYSSGNGRLHLPAVALDSVGTITSPTGVITLASLVDPLAGLVRVPSSEVGVWTVQVTGSAMPADLELAVLEIGRHLYNSQRTTLNTGQAAGVTVPAYTIPNRAKDLMEPYLVPGIG